MSQSTLNAKSKNCARWVLDQGIEVLAIQSQEICKQAHIGKVDNSRSVASLPHNVSLEYDVLGRAHMADKDSMRDDTKDNKAILAECPWIQQAFPQAVAHAP